VNIQISGFCLSRAYLASVLRLRLYRAMPALTRRRCPEAREECWLIYFGDVHVGTIAIRSGIPHDQPAWGWRCGFYLGSEPGECTSGTAATFDTRRAPTLRKHGKRSRPHGPRPTIRAWRHQRDWTARKYAMWERGERFSSQRPRAQ